MGKPALILSSELIRAARALLRWEQRDLAAVEAADRNHAHLNFSVERPTIARTKATIQKRMTICGSDQPSCSK